MCKNCEQSFTINAFNNAISAASDAAPFPDFYFLASNMAALTACNNTPPAFCFRCVLQSATQLKIKCTRALSNENGNGWNGNGIASTHRQMSHELLCSPTAKFLYFWHEWSQRWITSSLTTVIVNSSEHDMIVQMRQIHTNELHTVHLGILDPRRYCWIFSATSAATSAASNGQIAILTSKQPSTHFSNKESLQALENPFTRNNSMSKSVSSHSNSSAGSNLTLSSSFSPAASLPMPPLPELDGMGSAMLIQSVPALIPMPKPAKKRRNRGTIEASNVVVKRFESWVNHTIEGWDFNKVDWNDPKVKRLIDSDVFTCDEMARNKHQQSQCNQTNTNCMENIDSSNNVSAVSITSKATECKMRPVDEHIADEFLARSEFKSYANYARSEGGNCPPQRRLDISELQEHDIILIVGQSGSGKTSLLRQLVTDYPGMFEFKSTTSMKWNPNKSILSHFMTPEIAMEILGSVGLNSVPTWVKHVLVLSQGERYRCCVARLLQESIFGDCNSKPSNPYQQTNAQLQPLSSRFFILDEFTSKLDRQNAVCMSANLSKYIRRKRRQPGSLCPFVFASANIDIIPYLQPSLVISLSEGDDMVMLRNPNLWYSRELDVKVVINPLELTATSNVNIPRLSEQMLALDELKVEKSIPLSMNIVSRKRSRVATTPDLEAASKCFDIMFDGTITHDCPYIDSNQHLPKSFSIGIFMGPSASGKTTNVRDIFGNPMNEEITKQLEKNPNATVFSHFSSLADCQSRFQAVALPLKLGLRKYHELSDGEKERVCIAKGLGNGLIFDEFTSFLDRKTAIAVAKGVSDYVYQNKLKSVVLLACHYDVIGKDRLQPSFIVDMRAKTVLHIAPSIASAVPIVPIVSCCVSSSLVSLIPSDSDLCEIFPIPRIFILVKRAHLRDWDPLFSQHHYKSKTLLTNARCFIGWANFIIDDSSLYCDISNALVAWTAVAPHWGTHVQFDVREHRTVVLPEFQGLGFGSRFVDAVCELFSLENKRVQSKTAHPRYGGYRDDSVLVSWLFCVHVHV